MLIWIFNILAALLHFLLDVAVWIVPRVARYAWRNPKSAIVLIFPALFAWWALAPHWHLPANRARYTRLRLRLHLHPGRGYATLAELFFRWGRLASLRHSGRSRPALPFWYRALHPAEWSVFIGRAHLRHRLQVPTHEHLMIFSPPREGKTGFLARGVLRWRGPAVSATTKHDIFKLTSGIRRRRGPIFVLNPQFIGGLPSTFRWNLIRGCKDPDVAMRRADAFAHAVSLNNVEGGSFWSQKASDWLRALFCAADLANGDIRLVAQWIAGKGTAAAVNLLKEHGRAEFAATLNEIFSSAEKTSATVRMVLTRSMAFLNSPALASAVLPAEGTGFDIDSFLRRRGTLYLIAEGQSGEDSPLAPLFACLTSEIQYRACVLGSQQPGGRLDPPLLLSLDEVTQICPVPVTEWLADSGGKGITIHCVLHGMAQARKRWGDDGAQIIRDTTSCKLMLPGVDDEKSLEAASKLAGEVSYTIRGQEHPGMHAVAPPDVIRRLPPFRAFIIRTSCAPVIAKLGMAWRDPAYILARITGTAIAPVTAVTTAVPPLQIPLPSMADVTPIEAVSDAVFDEILDKVNALPGQTFADKVQNLPDDEAARFRQRVHAASAPSRNGNGNGHHPPAGVDAPWMQP